MPQANAYKNRRASSGTEQSLRSRICTIQNSADPHTGRRGTAVNDRNFVSPAVDDTVDLELTAEQMMELSLAAETAADVAPGSTSDALLSPKPLVGDSPASRSWHQRPIATMAGSTIALATLAWWCGSQLAGPAAPVAKAAVELPVVSPQPVSVTESANQAVQLINPFDPKEVFAFPAGTSEAESREQVAQILLQRARERQSQWERIKPRANLRTASAYRPP
jgi:hypothetical protein